MRRRKIPHNLLRTKSRKYCNRRYGQDCRWGTSSALSNSNPISPTKNKMRKAVALPCLPLLSCSTEWCQFWDRSGCTALLVHAVCDWTPILAGLSSGPEASWHAMSSTNAINYLSLQNHIATCELYSGNDSWPILTPKPCQTVLGESVGWHSSTLSQDVF